MSSYRMGKADGYVCIVDPDRPTVETDTLMCVHCNKHWTTQPGSGRQRGWCFKCAGPHCGAPRCWTCTPIEAQVEAYYARQRLAQAIGLVGR